MRTHLNDRSKEELIALMQALGFTSANHTLNVIITKAYKEIVLNSLSEVETNEPDRSKH